jgi:hypothetical protein
MNKRIRSRRKIYLGGIGVPVMLLLLAALSLAFDGCRSRSASQAKLTSSQQATPAPQSTFERDLQSVRSSQSFTKIYVFARSDGGAIESADAGLLKAKAPADPHIWWVLTDEKHRVIMGTYSDFAPDKLNSLRQHFIIEDYTNR